MAEDSVYLPCKTPSHLSFFISPPQTLPTAQREKKMQGAVRDWRREIFAEVSILLDHGPAILAGTRKPDERPACHKLMASKSYSAIPQFDLR
jgi:hypothetical protein